MIVIDRIRSIPKGQVFRYSLIGLSLLLFLSPLALIPGLFGNPDLCGPLCMRRFYLWFPGITADDVTHAMSVASIGVMALAAILVITFFFGRLWCAYICPVGGFPELVSRMLGDRWKLEFRWLPQIPIRYGYFTTYLILLPMAGVSACTLCNFITVPRLFQALSGDWQGIFYIVSAVGVVNLGLLFLLGFFASKGRAYCQFLCPIGAIDALVNRLGAQFHFVRRIRVERNRCTGCNECARQCMCGAIKMVDQVAVVDQLSCMSCHECADVCDWGAIDWLVVPPEIDHNRKKKGVDFHPLPEWVSVHRAENRYRRWRKKKTIATAVMLLAGGLAAGFWFSDLQAAGVEADPDGCMSCHALPGLVFYDKQGVLRQATIDQEHYLSSLHGGVACRDCHQQIKYFPHNEQNGAVDCAASCHLEEPSDGASYSHKPVAEEMQASVHGQAKSDGFTAANRLQEAEHDLYPSCRRCHSNTSYIQPDRMEEFKEWFRHSDEACGSCHQGEVWRNRFSGHVMRRLLGGRWNKQESNQLCQQCHANSELMGSVERQHETNGEPQPNTARFILAGATYEASLHGRLIAVGKESGASCLDCHAPANYRHAIAADESESAATHPSSLAETCGSGDCHGYADHPKSETFLRTDMHDMDWVPLWSGYESL
ncbi:MAG: 4Fe-4S binding protein, partial [Chromatiales bacterium]|nr:4Fe-4S binding protein [Chromatiales bacterium]